MEGQLNYLYILVGQHRQPLQCPVVMLCTVYTGSVYASHTLLFIHMCGMVGTVSHPAAPIDKPARAGARYTTTIM
jgi:hypothetical protein